MRILYFSILTISISLVLWGTAGFAQCDCWLNGIEEELVENSTGTSCETEGDRIILISEPSPEDFCDNHTFLSADFESCGTANIPLDPSPPPMMSCGPGVQSMSNNPGTCRQEIEDFCTALTAKNVPTLSSWALLATAVFLGLVGLIFARKNKLAS